MSAFSTAYLWQFSAIIGMDRKDRVEVVILSVNWLVIIVDSILLSRVFGRLLGTKREAT